MIDPAYKVVALMWAKDLAETALFAAIAYPVLRRVVKKYLRTLKCPHCGRHFTESAAGCQAVVPPYWNTELECTSETCHRPLPCSVHPPAPTAPV